jgi:hypothetical protein
MSSQATAKKTTFSSQSAARSMPPMKLPSFHSKTVGEMVSIPNLDFTLPEGVRDSGIPLLHPRFWNFPSIFQQHRYHPSVGDGYCF